MDELQLYAQFTSFDDDKRIVVGHVTSEQTDLGKNIVDANWFRSVLPPWFKQWGNIRANHNPMDPVGTAVEYSLDTIPGPMIAAHIVDDDAWNKCKRGVFKGFSIGVKYPILTRDPNAPKGRVIGGELIEISVVDRPANTDAKFVLVKSVGPHEFRDEQMKVVLEDLEPKLDPLDNPILLQTWAAEAELTKRSYSNDERKKYAKSGVAMSDGSYPIPDRDALHDAIEAYGRSPDEPTKSHIIKRAKALGATHMLPEKWTGGHVDDKNKSAVPGGEGTGTSIEIVVKDVTQPSAIAEALQRAEAVAATAADVGKAAPDAIDGAGGAIARPPSQSETMATPPPSMMTRGDAFREAIAMMERLANQTAADRDGDVDTISDLKASDQVQSRDFQSDQSGAKGISAQPLEQNMAAVPDLVKALGSDSAFVELVKACVASTVQQLVAEGVLVTKEAVADNMSTVADITKFAGISARGLEALASQVKAGQEQLGSVKADVAKFADTLEALKQMAQPMKGVTVAHKGFMGQGDTHKTVGEELFPELNEEQMVAQYAGMTDEQRTKFAARVYQLGTGAGR